MSLTEFPDEPISISNPSKRLLLLLITHHGEPVGREVIFKKVWDDYGMVSGNNNLNQCVSKLRRVIKNLGIEDEVIVTVPKVGFMLRYEIRVESCEGPEDRFVNGDINSLHRRRFKRKSRLRQALQPQSKRFIPGIPGAGGR